MKINQKLLGVDGVETLKGDKGIPLLLKDVCINALLTPAQQESEKVKWEKYVLFKKFRDAITEADGTIWIELKSEEVSLLKQAVGRTQTPLIMGQIWEMLEGGESKELKKVK